MTDRNNDEIRRHVADNYARAAEGEDNPCCTESEAGKSEAEKIAQKAGYSAEELDEDVSEAYRVLKAGGRLAISDVVKKREFPEEIKADPDNFSSCITGAITADKMRVLLKDAGFKDISIEPHDRSEEIVASWHDGFSVEDYIYLAGISAHKQDK